MTELARQSWPQLAEDFRSAPGSIGHVLSTEMALPTDTKVYNLSDTSVVKPLVNCWSAWSFGVAPGQANLHLANYQIKVLEVYLADRRAMSEPAPIL
jgi:hypothetical protein